MREIKITIKGLCDEEGLSDIKALKEEIYDIVVDYLDDPVVRVDI